MFSLFRKKASPATLEQQLSELSKCGIHLNSGVTVDDLLTLQTPEEYEAIPYKELIPVLGCDIQRKPYTPICDRLWMCDYERIDDHGTYSEVLIRLQKMSNAVLPISNISDFVDIEKGIAWLEFDLDGHHTHWDATVDNDWLDPHIIVKFDELLLTHHSQCRIYSNHSDFGQSALFACFTQVEFEQFKKLATFEISGIAEQAS
ncbi:hypothetical protein [Undibacterium flavidum]|uniref:SMI1/KNR4 family protein SUKH-1 n=1 Tax=Undibacterium flavidum TaxID=2762297 RepID=A0ABR6YH14_9BURK|nr:hypothetical protein [Undibacterium flavidum]MBC3875832.1 hypothetical protein [Undibacterium flavidum]